MTEFKASMIFKRPCRRHQAGYGELRRDQIENPAARLMLPLHLNPLEPPATLSVQLYHLFGRVGENGGPSVQSNPLPVESTTRSDLSFIEEEVEEEEEEETL
ncbi:hypothetical protein VTK56DRAFT_7212 [Thermocarpiscus australiensis]